MGVAATLPELSEWTLRGRGFESVTTPAPIKIPIVHSFVFSLFDSCHLSYYFIKLRAGLYDQCFY